jgi:hypothetical protein
MSTHPHPDTGLVLLEPVDDPGQLLGVAAGELFEWAWLALELADWLDHAAQTTQADFHRFFNGLRSPEATASFLTIIGERMGALFDADRGQP